MIRRNIKVVSLMPQYQLGFQILLYTSHAYIFLGVFLVIMMKQCVSSRKKLPCAVFIACKLQFCARMRARRWNCWGTNQRLICNSNTVSNVELHEWNEISLLLTKNLLGFFVWLELYIRTFICCPVNRSLDGVIFPVRGFTRLFFLS